MVITARPSYSRIKTVLTAIHNHPELQLQLVVAASALLDRYGSTINTIVKDGFSVDAKAFTVLEGENLTSSAKTTGLGILELSTIFDNLKPDIVVTIADRYETMATAIAASYMNIPLAHIQGGEVTGSIDEKVRHAITKLADYHFVATEQAKQRVIKLGENPDCVFNTGCPSIDIAASVKNATHLDFNPYEKYGGVGTSPDLSNGYLVVLQHPVTNEYNQSRTHIEQTLEAVKNSTLPVLWFWPNVDAGSDGTSNGIRAFRETHKPINMHFFKNMEGDDFLKLLANSTCLIGNSSVGIRECSYLGVPVINIGSRQHLRERGNNVIDVGYNKIEIENAIQQIKQNARPAASQIYGGGDAGIKIADLLNSVQLKFHKTINY